MSFGNAYIVFNADSLRSGDRETELTEVWEQKCRNPAEFTLNNIEGTETVLRQ